MNGPMGHVIKAIRRGDRDRLESLLKSGADPNEKDRDQGRTALMHAVGTPGNMAANPRCMELLIDMGANVNVKDNDGKTALMLASVRIGASGAVRLLMTNGANLDEKDKFGRTAIMYASKNGIRDCVGLLVANGARLDEKNLSGHTARDMATGRCEADLLLHAQRQEAIRAVLSDRFAARFMTDDAFLAVLVDTMSRMAYSPAEAGASTRVLARA